MGQIMVYVIFCIYFGIFLVGYFKSKGIYEEYLEAVNKEDYVFKFCIPLGLYWNDVEIDKKLIPRRLHISLARYESNMYGKILQIYGVPYAQFHFMIYKGYRTGLGIIVGAFLAFMAGLSVLSSDLENSYLFAAMAVTAGVSVPYLIDSSLKEKIKKKQLSIQMEFPEFVNKLTLLVNAGMTVSKAWEKIISDNQKENPLYMEMRYALAEIKAGISETVAYEEFARRCKLKEVTKCVSVIIMNLRRGGSEIVPVLKQQGNECWEMRKAAAKQLGEEAGTKIMLPMMIMFFGVMLIVATPALLSFTSGM